MNEQQSNLPEDNIPPQAGYGVQSSAPDGFSQPTTPTPYNPQPTSDPFAQPTQPQYGGYQHPAILPEHPQAQTVLILGIVGFFVPIVCFVAWYMGGKAKKEIQAGAPYRWEGSVKIGYVLGIVASILAIIGMVFYALVFVLFAGAIFSDFGTDPSDLFMLFA